MKIAKLTSTPIQTTREGILENYYVVEDNYDFVGNLADDVTSYDNLAMFYGIARFNEKLFRESLINNILPYFTGLTTSDQKNLVFKRIYPTGYTYTDIVNLVGVQGYELLTRTVSFTELIDSGETIVRNYTGQTEARLDQIEETALYGVGTGFLTGGTFTHSGGTTFTVNPGRGLFVDQYTNPIHPFGFIVNWTGGVFPILTGTPVTYVSVTSGGTIVRKPSQPTPIERRNEIVLGLVVHPSGTITTTNQSPVPAYDILPTTHDLAEAIGLVRIDDGNAISGANSNLQLKKTAGSIFYFSSNLRNNLKNPNFKSFTQQSPLTFRYRDIEGVEGANTTFVDPLKYEKIDSGGTTSTLVTITGSPSQATVQKVFMFQSGEVKVQYGQKVYESLQAAFANFLGDPFTIEEDISNDGLLIGVIVLRVGTTNLGNGSDAIFVNTSRTGSILGSINGGQFVLNKYQLVKSVADLPEPIGGDIFLQDDFEYRINGTVDLKGNRLVLANNNALIGENSSTDIIVGSGSSLVYGRGKSVTMIALRFTNTVPTNKVFDYIGNSTTFFVARRTIFANTRCGNIGNTNLYIFDNVFLSQVYDGLIISGQSVNSGDVFITDLEHLRPRSNSRAIVITGGSFNSIRVSGSHFLVTGSTTALRINSGTTLTTNGVVQSNQFFGNGTYVGGTLTKAAPNWDFRGNTNLLDSETFGFLRFSGNTSVTVINSTTDFVKAAGTNFNSSSERVTVSDNRLTNNSNKTLNFIVVVNGDLSVGGGAETIQVALVKNGTSRQGTVEVRTTTANQPVPYGYNDIVSLAQGDYLEIYVRNLTSNADITLRNLQFRINLA